MTLDMIQKVFFAEWGEKIIEILFDWYKNKLLFCGTLCIVLLVNGLA